MGNWNKLYHIEELRPIKHFLETTYIDRTGVSRCCGSCTFWQMRTPKTGKCGIAGEVSFENPPCDTWRLNEKLEKWLKLFGLLPRTCHGCMFNKFEDNEILLERYLSKLYSGD